MDKTPFYRSIGNSRLTVSAYEYRSAKVPKSFSGFKILQVSDLHNRTFGEGQRGLVSAVEEQAPDIIAVTGDLVDRRHTDIFSAFCFIRKAVSLRPVYFVTGNHEEMSGHADRLIRVLSAAGVNVLDARRETIRRGADAIRIAGIPDPSRYGVDSGVVRADVRQIIKELLKSVLGGATGALNILLAHRPELADIYSECGADIALCGHVHGGQIRLPYLGGLYSPGQGLFPRLSAGITPHGGTALVISRGLGNSLFPLRVFNPPELVVVKLVSV